MIQELGYHPSFNSREKFYKIKEEITINNEEVSESDVLYRKISGTEPDKIIVMLDYYE